MPGKLWKMVGKRTASDFLNLYKKSAINIIKASSLPEEELKDKIVVGEFIDRDRKEFTESLRDINKEKLINR